jgi:hypothetical protein
VIVDATTTSKLAGIAIKLGRTARRWRSGGRLLRRLVLLGEGEGA